MAHGHAPARNSTRRIVLLDPYKLFLGLLVPEGMQHSHATFDRTLHGSRARCRKMHGSDLGFRHFLVMVTFICNRKRARQDRQNSNAKNSLHGSTTGKRVYSAAGTEVKGA